MKVRSRELAGNRLLRVAEVQEPSGSTTVVVDLSFDSDGMRSLLEPGADQRLTLDAAGANALRKLLEEWEEADQ